MPGLNPILKEIIWLIVKLVLEGMSREKAITTVAKERGLDAEELRRKFL
ncbi:hypothetical protein M4D57_24770 [Brevibacillus borstelensis]|nr:hypothetical protein [Brevibacillus borstelensis]MCM3561750.1 hypothetical protein [Brevibacillus borstelensis]